MNPKTALKILIVIYILAFMILSLIFIFKKPEADSVPARVPGKSIEAPKEEAISEEEQMRAKKEKEAEMINILTRKASGTKTSVSSPSTNTDDTPEETAKKEEILKILKKSNTQEQAISNEEIEKAKKEKEQAVLDVLTR